MNLEFQIPVVVSTTPKSGLEVRSVWLWPQLGQYWEVSGTSELQYQHVAMRGHCRSRAAHPLGSSGLAENSGCVDQGELFPAAAGVDPKSALPTRLGKET